MATKKKPVNKADPAVRTVYSEEVVDEICSRISRGERLVMICKDPSMPGYSTFMQWLLEGKHEGLSDKYARAREAQADFYAQEIVDIADTPVVFEKTKINEKGERETTEGDSPEHRRLQIDAREWYASKVAPKKYGDKQEVVHSGQVDIANALAAARGRSGTAD